MRMHSQRIWRLIAALLILISALPVSAQDDVRLRILGIDTSEFPVVRVRIATADARSAPISDLSQLTLYENGEPISDYSVERIPTGIDATFVIDANPDVVGVDDESGLTRLEKVKESIRRYAESYMSPAGLDRVSIIVPGEDGQSGQYLLQDAARPEEVLAALDAYAPASLSQTPLNEMITLALDQVQQRGENGRFHPVLLFSDGRRLSTQLSYPLLTGQANDSETPIYVAILGAVADDFEIENARGLFEPTRAAYVHMPSGSETDAVYEIWRDQSDQAQLSYRSQQGQNGTMQLNINLGSVQAGGSFDLALQAPEVQFQEEPIKILRIGAAPDSALVDLQPAVQPLTATITWPDGLPRALSEVRLLVNGQPQTVLQSLPAQAEDTITIDWDISSLVEGEFDLVLSVTDELGYQSTSPALPASLSSERPAPPAPQPTAVPDEGAGRDILAALPLESIPLPWQRLSWLSGDIAAGLTGIALILLIAVFWRNRDKQSTEERLQELLSRVSTPTAQPQEAAGLDEPLTGRLEPFAGAPTEHFEFLKENVTIGRSEGEADIVIPHESLAVLHARIRRQNDDYWLFDEGGAEGTYLNFERLGLAPRLLQDGDVVQFGKISYRFRLGAGEDPKDSDMYEAIVDEVVILDMDGLMVDTEPLSRRAWDQVLADLGYGPLEDDFYNTLIGRRLWETADILVAHYQLPIESNELAWRKELLLSEIRSTEMTVMPGLYDLLDALKQRGIYWGVATSTPRHVAEEILSTINVLGSCKVLAAGDEVPQGKPQPDVYLLAAERFDKDPGQCLVFEDSPNGCRAADAAGMMVVAVPNQQDLQKSFTCADHILTSLQDVPDHLDQLLAELRQR